MKACNHCKEEKSLAEFSVCRSSRDGLQPKCKPCSSAASNAWNKANRDKTKVYDLRRHKKHQAARIASYQRWLSANPDKKKQYADTHNMRRRAQRLGNGGTHTQEEISALKASYHGLCAYCTSAANEIDHVVPLSHGGGNEISNLVPACGSCNRRKFNGSLLTFMFRKAA